MPRKPRILFLFLAFFASNVFAKNEPDCAPYPLSRVNIRHREHHGVGWDKGYSSFTAFVMPKNNLFFIPFLDARLHVFNDGDIASNLGVGARFAPKKSAPIVGLNVYYDFREYSSFSSHQASAGFEVLSSVVDFRASGYYPFSGKTKEEDVFFHTFKGNYALFKQEILYSLPCADAELGFFLPEPMKQIKLYLAAGGYYLFKQHALHHQIGNAPGFKARLSATPEDWISFNVEYTYDRLFKSRTNASINFNIPLGKKETPSKKKSKYQKRHDPCQDFYAFQERKSQDTYHNEIIPFYHEKHLFSPASSKTGLAHSFVFVNNTNLDPLEIGSGSGTFEDPYTTLKLGEENSKPYDIVYVFYGRGNDAGYNKGFNFQNEQLLTSGAVPIYIDGYFIPAFEPGLNPYVSNFKNSAISTILAQNLDFITLQGFNLSSKTSNVVELTSVGAQISNNTLNATSNIAALVHFSPSSGFILENKFNDSGIEVINGYPAKSYNIVGNSFSYKGGTGISFENVAENIFIANNTFEALTLASNAILFTNGSYVDGLNSCNVIYRNNSTIKGSFNYGIYNTFGINQPLIITASNNNFSNGVINNNGFFYLGYNDNSCITLSENNIKAAITGISIENHGANFLAKIEENNILTSQNSGSFGIVYKTYDSGSLSVLNNTSSSYAPLDITNYIPKIGLLTLDIQKNNLISNNFILSIRNNGVGSTYGNILNNTQSFYSSAGALQNSSVEANGGNICLNYSDNISLAKNSFLNLINQTSGTFQMATDAPPSRQSLYNQNTNIGIDDTGYSPITYVIKGTPCPDIRPTFYVDSSSTKPNPDGSLQNPYHTITDAISHSEVGSLIFVFPGNGYSEGVSLLEDQILASSGATFTLDGKQYTKSTSRPVITNDGSKPTITGANNNSIYGFQFVLTGGTDAITASNIDNILIDQNNFNLTRTEAAIFITYNSATISNNSFVLSNSNRFINASMRSDSSTMNINNNSFTLDSDSFTNNILLSNDSQNTTCIYTLVNNSFLTQGTSSKTSDFFFDQNSDNSNIFLSSNVFNQKMNLNFNVTQKQDLSSFSMLQNNSTGAPMTVNIKEVNTSVLKFDSNASLPESQVTINAAVTTSSCVPTITKNDYDFIFSPTAGTANVYFPNTQNYFQLTNQNPNGSFIFDPAITPTYNTPCP